MLSRYPADRRHFLDENSVFTLKGTLYFHTPPGIRIRFPSTFSGGPRKTDEMRFAGITAALALLATAVTALDKPLDIKVDKAVDCKRKTQRGMALSLHVPLLPDTLESGLL